MFLSLGLPYVNWAGQECCWFYLRFSLRSSDLPLFYFRGLSLPGLLATAILDSFPLFYRPNTRTASHLWTQGPWGRSGPPGPPSSQTPPSPLPGETPVRTRGRGLGQSWSGSGYLCPLLKARADASFSGAASHPGFTPGGQRLGLEGAGWTLTQGPYTFCSPQQVLPTMRTCPLSPAQHTRKCAQEAYSVALGFLWGMWSSPSGTPCWPPGHWSVSPMQVLPHQRFPWVRQEPQGPAHGRSPDRHHKPREVWDGHREPGVPRPHLWEVGGGQGGWPWPARTRGLCAHWRQTSAPPHDVLGPRPPGAAGPLHR